MAAAQVARNRSSGRGESDIRRSVCQRCCRACCEAAERGSDGVAARRRGRPGRRRPLPHGRPDRQRTRREARHREAGPRNASDDCAANRFTTLSLGLAAGRRAKQLRIRPGGPANPEPVEGSALMLEEGGPAVSPAAGHPHAIDRWPMRRPHRSPGRSATAVSCESRRGWSRSPRRARPRTRRGRRAPRCATYRSIPRRRRATRRHRL